jgi:hypothetical protein
VVVPGGEGQEPVEGAPVQADYYPGVWKEGVRAFKVADVFISTDSVRVRGTDEWGERDFEFAIAGG